MRRHLSLVSGIAAHLIIGAMLFSGSANAQTYPNQNIRIIVPFSPGGTADVLARMIAPKLSEALGQSVVVENRSGASGALGVGEVVRSAPDGYTLLVTTGDFITVPPEMFPEMKFEPRKALLPIMRLATVPLILLGNADAPFSDVKELIAAAKASPGKYAYSTPGPGTINHIAVEWLALSAGIKLLHVPYRGGAPAVTAITTGEVQLGVSGPASSIAAIQSGRTRALGLMDKEKPAFITDITPVAQQGLPDIDASLFVGLFAAANTPPAIADRLSLEIRKFLEDEAVRKKVNGFGVEISLLSGAAFRDYIVMTGDRYARVVRDANIKIAR